MCNCFFPDPLGIVFAVNDRLYDQRSTMAPLRGSALVQQAANQLRCHSEPVRFPGVGISIVIENAFL